MTDPWRYACPEGHRNLEYWGHGATSGTAGPTAWCDTCGKAYARDQVRDLKAE
jgi:hypothetical protein